MENDDGNHSEVDGVNHLYQYSDDCAIFLQWKMSGHKAHLLTSDQINDVKLK